MTIGTAAPVPRKRNYIPIGTKISQSNVRSRDTSLRKFLHYIVYGLRRMRSIKKQIVESLLLKHTPSTIKPSIRKSSPLSRCAAYLST